jgi:peptidoglycan/LPS O-acetylase OafA/YrhL
LWLIAAAAVWFGPRTPDFALTLVLYVALAAVCVLSVGLMQLAEERRLGPPAEGHSLRVALSIAAIASAAFGVGAYFMRPSPGLVRWLLMAAAAIEGLALFAVALRRMPGSPAIEASRKTGTSLPRGISTEHPRAEAHPPYEEEGP